MTFRTWALRGFRMTSSWRIGAILALLTLVTSGDVFAQNVQQSTVLFQNVRIFDGKGGVLSTPSNVLIRGYKIEQISTSAIPVDRTGDTRIIDGNGRTLMPGLIDAHAHLMFSTLPLALLSTADPNYLQFRAGAAAKDFLLAGFTLARDLSGPSFGMKRAIDEGLIVGPRIWPSGPMISQTSGHSDFRALNQLPSSVVHEPHPGVRFGYLAIADGVPEMLKVVREQLMQGASQIKLAVGGGVSSNYDPIDVTEYSLEEIKAAVGAAEDWGTYVTVHGYTPRAVGRAIEAGVKCIEHGQLLDEPTIQLMAEKGIWLSTQPFLRTRTRSPRNRVQITSASTSRWLRAPPAPTRWRRSTK